MKIDGVQNDNKKTKKTSGLTEDKKVNARKNYAAKNNSKKSAKKNTSEDEQVVFIDDSRVAAYNVSSDANAVDPRVADFNSKLINRRLNTINKELIKLDAQKKGFETAAETSSAKKTNKNSEKSTEERSGIGNWWLSQTYKVDKIFAEDKNFGNIMDTALHSSQYYDDIQDDKERGPVYLKSDKLTDTQEKEAREEAVKLLEERLKSWEDNRPDYGDVRSYYNYGSVADWLVGHPITFGAKAIADKNPDSGFSKTFNSIYKSKVLGEDGCFTPLNWFNYMEKGSDDGKDENGVRQDYYTDAMAVKDVAKIDADVEEKRALIKELRENIDNPEKFAELYYKTTEGVNFDAEKVLEYSKDNSTHDQDVVLGRNYIAADYAKNEMATDAAYNVNKTVGTLLCKMIPVAGVPIACAINVGVTELEENTKKNNDMTWKDHVKLVLVECAKTIGIMKGTDIAKGILSKTGASGNAAATSAVSSGVRESMVDSSKAIGDLASGDGGSFIGDVVQLFTNPKTAAKSLAKKAWEGVKSGAKSLFGKIFHK